MEMIGGWLGGLFSTNWGMLAVGAVSAFIGKWLAKKIPFFIADKFGGKLKEILNLEDSADRALVLAWVRWAEAKLPDAGLGEKRKELVMAFLSRLFPRALASVLSDIIELAVKQMDEELKKAQ